MKDQSREREFIHAMASPLAGIEMILESVLEDITDKGDDSDGYSERVRDALSGLEKMKILLKERRQEILNDK